MYEYISIRFSHCNKPIRHLTAHAQVKRKQLVNKGDAVWSVGVRIDGLYRLMLLGRAVPVVNARLPLTEAMWSQIELCADELVVGGGVGWSYDRRRRRQRRQTG